MRWDLCVLGNALILAGCASPYARVSHVHPHLTGAPGANSLAAVSARDTLAAAIALHSAKFKKRVSRAFHAGQSPSV